MKIKSTVLIASVVSTTWNNDAAAGFNKYESTFYIDLIKNLSFFFLFHSILRAGFMILQIIQYFFKHFLSSKRVLSSNKSKIEMSCGPLESYYDTMSTGWSLRLFSWYAETPGVWVLNLPVLRFCKRNWDIKIKATLHDTFWSGYGYTSKSVVIFGIFTNDKDAFLSENSWSRA